MFYPKFEEISLATEDEKLLWEEARQKTYLDSPRHFYYSLVHKQLESDFYSLREGSASGAKILSDDLRLAIIAILRFLHSILWAILQ
jgi:hypothetical protein